ncbi:hypothetical protein TorRG33x02_050620, partial [Trema orientale]
NNSIIYLYNTNPTTLYIKEVFIVLIYIGEKILAAVFSLKVSLPLGILLFKQEDEDDHVGLVLPCDAAGSFLGAKALRIARLLSPASLLVENGSVNVVAVT